MTGTNYKIHWSWRLISPSLTLSISCQSSLQIIAPVHSPSVNSPSNYLIPILFCFFAPLHPSISTCTFIFYTSITPVFNCSIVTTSPLRIIYCLTPLILHHLHTLYIDFSIVLLIVCLFIPCVTLCCCLCHTALLYLARSQLCMRTCSQLAYLVK